MWCSRYNLAHGIGLVVDFNRNFASLRRLVKLKLQAFDWVTKSK
jgi:hypothetical protein